MVTLYILSLSLHQKFADKTFTVQEKLLNLGIFRLSNVMYYLVIDLSQLLGIRTFKFSHG